MSDLRDRLRDLDALDVPDVMAHADQIGPKTPMHMPPRPARRVAVVTFALILTVASVVFLSRAFERSEGGPVPVGRQTVDPSAPCSMDTSTIPIPLKGGNRVAAHGVAGTSPQDLWVSASKDPWTDQYLLHYDGSTWSEVKLPSDLTYFHGETQDSGGMVSPAPGQVWLTAPNGIARYDGARWSRWNFGGASTIADFVSVSPDDAWLTGELFDATTRTTAPAVLHWDGNAWQPSYRATGDADAPDALTGISSWEPNDVWAAGSMRVGTRLVPVALHWDGTSWTSHPATGFGEGHGAITAVGPDEALLTVGSAVIRWDGQQWVDAGLDATSEFDVPLEMDAGGSGVWARMWDGVADRWNGESWRQGRLPGLGQSYAMSVIGDDAVFVGAPGNAVIYTCGSPAPESST